MDELLARLTPEQLARLKEEEGARVLADEMARLMAEEIVRLMPEVEEEALALAMPAARVRARAMLAPMREHWKAAVMAGMQAEFDQLLLHQAPATGTKAPEEDADDSLMKATKRNGCKDQGGGEGDHR